MVNPNRFYTYAYFRENGTPYYIGKGKGRRIYEKRKDEIGKPTDKSRIIFLKQNLTEEEAFKHEIYMIAVFDRKDLGTGILRNKTDGGEGGVTMLGNKHTKESIRKMSEVKKGKKFTEEHKRKIGEAHKGRTLTEEHKKKIGIAGKGRTYSEESRKKISDARKGKTHTEETKRKMSESAKGRVHSEESKRKMSEAKKKKC